jgi:hypothetical protein
MKESDACSPQGIFAQCSACKGKDCKFFLHIVMFIEFSNGSTILISGWCLVTDPKFDYLKYSIMQTGSVLKSIFNQNHGSQQNSIMYDLWWVLWGLNRVLLIRNLYHSFAKKISSIFLLLKVHKSSCNKKGLIKKYIPLTWHKRTMGWINFKSEWADKKTTNKHGFSTCKTVSAVTPRGGKN